MAKLSSSSCLSSWQVVMCCLVLLCEQNHAFGIVPNFSATVAAANSHALSSSRSASATKLSSTAAAPESTSDAAAVSSSDDTCVKVASELLANDEEFVKSEPDKRMYRAIRLEPSGLQCLLVSDSQTDVESASVHVKAGHFNDPDHRAGLAHFHEHMLFLGTAKYPDENDYESYLSKNGGSSNAYTDMEDTNYYFNVAPLDHDDDDDENEETGTSAALSGALDRFAQFFIEPKFSVDSVERELRAINSEYLNGMTSDAWRSYQLLKQGSAAGHPFTKFGCGNYNTLTNGGDIAGESAEASGGSSPRDDLIKFWEDNYQPHNLRLCVVGRASLDDLQKTVEATFGPVPPSRTLPKEKPAEVVTEDPEDVVFVTEHATNDGLAAFGPEQVGKIREVVPLLESRTMKLAFGFPPMDDSIMKKSRPYRVISHLLGHESPGSLHSLLADEGLINSLSSGVGVDASDFALASLNLSLTPKGMKQRDHVLDLVWQWISLIHSIFEDDALMEKYHIELQQIADLNFRFRENGDPTDFCSAAASVMFDHEPAEILLGSARAGPYDPRAAKALLKRMVPENCLITIVDPDLESGDSHGSETSAHESPWETEKWYRAQYREKKIDDALMTKWKAPPAVDERLKLPALNEYIPQDFSLRCDDEKSTSEESASDEAETDYTVEPPNLIEVRPDLRLWHKMDKKWRVPKTALRMHLTSPNVYRSPRTMTLARLYQKVLNDDLNEFAYDASMAGCNYRVACVPTGFRLSVTGYSEKLSHLFDTVTTRMFSILEEMKEGPEAHPGLAQKFNKAVENLARETKNYRLDAPYEVGSYNSRILLETPAWHVDSYVAEMEGDYAESHPLTMEECAETLLECLSGRVKAEALCMGNIDEAGARQVGDVIDQHFLAQSRALSEDETPKFLSHKVPTRSEAARLFGTDSLPSIPFILEDVAFSESEENNSVELTLQVGSEFEVGYEGVALLELIGYMAYNSAFNQLRTKEQLGYIVSAFTRKTAGGSLSMDVVVQSSVALPPLLEERCEAWLEGFRKELEEMPAERIAMEASAVVAQILERDTKLSDEISSMWGEIMTTETLSERLKQPAFDRLERLAEYLAVEGFVQESDTERITPKVTASQLKDQMLAFFDKHFAANSEDRRAMSTRVYCHTGKEIVESNKGKPGILSDYSDIRHMKQFLSLSPRGPYW